MRKGVHLDPTIFMFFPVEILAPYLYTPKTTENQEKKLKSCTFSKWLQKVVSRKQYLLKGVRVQTAPKN